MASNDRLGELLVREKVISPAQLDKARNNSRRNQRSIGHELVKQGLIKESDMTSFLSKMHGVPSIDLSDYEIPDKVLELIPDQVARRHTCIPINRSGSTLIVAMADPSNIYAIDDLKFMTGYNIEVVVASESAIEEAITASTAAARAWGALPSTSTMTTSSKISTSTTSITSPMRKRTSTTSWPRASEDAPVIRLVNAILLDAIKRGASDIHIEPYEKDRSACAFASTACSKR